MLRTGSSSSTSPQDVVLHSNLRLLVVNLLKSEQLREKSCHETRAEPAAGLLQANLQKTKRRGVGQDSATSD